VHDKLIKYVETSPNTVKKRFVISNDGGAIQIDFEVENALHPHNWRTEGSIKIDDQDEAATYLAIAGVRI
jgi:hypothetical protein